MTAPTATLLRTVIADRSPDRIRNALENARANGRLIRIGAHGLTKDGRYYVVAYLRQPAATAHKRLWRHGFLAGTVALSAVGAVVIAIGGALQLVDPIAECAMGAAVIAGFCALISVVTRSGNGR